MAGETGRGADARSSGSPARSGIRSVAEGVETPEHLRMVREAGCDLAQGWLLGQAMPADGGARLRAAGCSSRAATCARSRVARCAVPQAG